MICLFGRNTTDYSGNGLRVLDPYALEGQITEELNGDYTFELTLSPQAGALNLQEDMVVRLPAPVRETPYISILHPGTEGTSGTVSRGIRSLSSMRIMGLISPPKSWLIPGTCCARR